MSREVTSPEDLNVAISAYWNGIRRWVTFDRSRSPTLTPPSVWVGEQLLGAGLASVAGGFSAEVVCIAFDGSDHVLLGGYFTGTADFDPGAGSVQVNSAGDKDAYVLKLTQTTVGLLEGESSASLQVYPNPANALIHVKVVEPTTVSILNALGQECLRRVVTQSEAIDLSGFEVGIYIVKDLNTGKALKFIKQ